MLYNVTVRPPESGGLKGPWYVMGSGETNQVPAKKWPFAPANAPLRVRFAPMPTAWPWSSCAGKDYSCDWWREKIHRNLAWMATTAANEYNAAKTALASVPGSIDVAEYLKLYITPLKVSANAINVEAGSEFTKKIYSSSYSQPACTGKSFCENHYYPRQYWQDLSVLIDAYTADLEASLTKKVSDAIDAGYGDLSAKELVDSILGGETPDVIDWGVATDFEEVLKEKGIDGFTFTPQKPLDVPWTPDPGGTSAALDPFQQAMASAGAQAAPAPIDTKTLLMIGGGLLAVVLLMRKK